jgi:translocation and assembly module TamB
LSLHIEGGRNITIQNQLAEVEARVEIDLKGTVDQPAITGRVEASGGTLSFQGNRYTVTRGNIDFVDPLRIQPVIDIEAEAQVRDYRVAIGRTIKYKQVGSATS